METSTDTFTPEQRVLFESISEMTVTLWNHAPYLHAWYSHDVCKLHESLVLNAKDSRWLWGACFVVAATTIH